MRAHSVSFRGGIALCVLILASVSIHRGIASEILRSTQKVRDSAAQAGANSVSANHPAVLFTEDFEDGQAQGWEYNPARWSIIADTITGSQVWSTTGLGTAFASSGEKDWGDYRLKFDARRVNSDANVYFRGAYGNGYALRLESSRVVLWTELGGSPQDLDSASLAIGTAWHDYAADAVGTTITVTVDGGPAFSYTHTGLASLHGGIALEAFDNDGARFDNIQVLDLSRPQPAPWTQTNGPSGGLMDAVEMHPSNPSILFAGGVGGVYKSSDAGQTWQLLPAFISPVQRVTRLLVDPGNPQVMYALSGQLYKTTDGGLNWETLDNGRWFRTVTMDTSDPQHLLAGDNSGQVFLSTNGGAAWSIISNLPARPILALAFAGENEFWAGCGADPDTHLGLLYHTTTGGASWTAMTLGQSPETEVYSIFVDPQNSAVVHVGMQNIYNEMFNPSTSAYLFRTANGGGNWSTLHLPQTDSTVDIIGKDLSAGWLYVNTGRNLFKSANGIDAWVAIMPANAAADGSRDIAIHPVDGNKLYLPSPFRGGIYYTANGGSTWTKYTQGLLNTSVSLLALGNASGSVAYAAAVSGEGTYKTSDYGATWSNVTEGGISHPWADELRVSPVDPQTVWEVADVGKLFVSKNGGSTWAMAFDPQNGYGFRAGTVSALALAPSDPDIQYAVKSGFGIFKSTNGGWWWDFLQRSEVDYSYSLAVHPTDPDTVFSGYVPKPFQDWAMLRRSQDGGDTWTTVLSVTHSTGITSVTFDPQDPQRMYAGSGGAAANGGGQIYHSLDGGGSWSPLNPHFTMLTVWGQPQLVGDPSNPSTAYAATWLGGTWKTTDAGESWTRLADAPLSATSLSLDPANPAVIYASDRTAPKIWKSADGGLNWFTVADFSADHAFLVNRVLATSGAVYAATFGPGIHDGKLYRSVNGGATWVDIMHNLPRSVLDIAVHPTNAEIIYVTTHIYGAYKTVNGGADWTEMTGFPDIGGYDIEIDPVTPDTVFAAGLGNTTVPDWVLPGGYTFSDSPGVYRSQDGGVTWHQVLSNSNECRAVRFHPANHNLLFATALSDGFFFSPDNGTTWYNMPLTHLDTYNLTAVWAAGDKIYAGTQGFGVYAGDLDPTTGAVTWVPGRSNKPVPDVYNLQVQVDPADSQRIYVSANPGGLFRSDDGGNSWFDKNFLTPSVAVDDPRRQGYYNFAIHPADSSEVWVGTWGKGVYKSYDGQDYNIGANGSSGVMFGKHINALLFHPTLGWLAASEEGIFRTDDDGTTWQDFSDGLATTQVRTLNRGAAGTLYAGTAGYELYYRQAQDDAWHQLRAFSNFGTFWPIWNDRPLYQYTTLLFHPTDANIVYFGAFPSGIFKSLDGGTSWREYNVGWLNDGVFSLAFHPQDTQVIYAGTYNGVSRSLDGGQHWERWDNGWPGEQWVFSLDFDPDNPDILYACSKNGENEGTGRDDFHGTVMKSTDGGESWFPITTGLDLNQEFYKIIVDRFDPQIVYLATQRQGVFISYNGGAYWQPWNTGLTNLTAGVNGNNVTNTMALSGDGMTLYFGTAGSGVFRRSTIVMNDIYLPLVFKKPQTYSP